MNSDASERDHELVASGTRHVAKWVEEPLSMVRYEVVEGTTAVITLSRFVTWLSQALMPCRCRRRRCLNHQGISFNHAILHRLLSSLHRC